MKEVEFLGVVIETEGIKIEQEKIKAVLYWPILSGIKDVQKFLGLANYYKWFVKNFAFITRPLHDLVKKEQKWEWELR